MKRSAIYREAAKLIDSGCAILSCHAIARADGKDAIYRSRLARSFEQHMGFDALNELWPLPSDARQRIRVLLLCLASAIAESEGK